MEGIHSLLASSMRVPQTRRSFSLIAGTATQSTRWASQAFTPDRSGVYSRIFLLLGSWSGFWITSLHPMLSDRDS